MKQNVRSDRAIGRQLVPRWSRRHEVHGMTRRVEHGRSTTGAVPVIADALMPTRSLRPSDGSRT
jgi:hypothetical protein